ncbi:MAG: hypothetical protein KAI83_20195 [Thiomargarita sp.]|nr:hypothetical protein [Thiomargarita sp.]
MNVQNVLSGQQYIRCHDVTIKFLMAERRHGLSETMFYRCSANNVNSKHKSIYRASIISISRQE